jgi:5-oxoprolinase (ATP-hydrolysing)
MSSGWEFWIDRGGTFTDVVARSPDGALQALKLLSESPGQYADAAVEGVRRALARATAATAVRIAAVKMGTTVATNALLERRGEPTALVITAGLKDAIRIGGQQRPDIFALDIRLPEMLYERVIEAHERVSAHGDVLIALDGQRLGAELAAARAAGLRSVAIVLLHGYRFPAHEAAAERLARAAGFEQVSVSHRVSPLLKLVLRGDTTLVDAYLSPVLRRYVASVRRGLAEAHGDAPLFFMQSHGGLTDAAHFEGKDSLLSGPAGGVIGTLHAARSAGFDDVVGFDMGGTSTDVSLYAGELERTSDAVIAAVRVSAPMLKVHTVAAGGGSIVAFANGRLQVGPASAGALPGPACYRNGGAATVTDANVLLGRIQPDFFPRVFGPEADQPLDAAASAAAFARLAEEVAAARGAAATGADPAAEPAPDEGPAEAGAPATPEELAAGSLRIAVERMANAIKQISVQRGHDVTRFALCCFGGAAGQHACQVADALGIKSIVIHPLAGVLSAYGIGVADVRELRRKSVETRLDDGALAALATQFDALASEARAALDAQGVGSGQVAVERRVALKIDGTDAALPARYDPASSAAALRAAFHAAHERHFGFEADPAATIVVEAIEVEAMSAADRAPPPAPPHSSRERAEVATPAARRRAFFNGAWQPTPLYERAALVPGAAIAGPAIVVEAHATTVLESGWHARVDAGGCLIVTRSRSARRKETVRGRPDPIMLEVFNNLFMHVAEQMGVVLENTAHSVNIKERLDFSCALFDAAGDLVANAPHIPVHLGSMGASVQSVLRLGPKPGEVYMLNTPYNGGTHLPDVTVVTPVFETRGETGAEMRATSATRGTRGKRRKNAGRLRYVVASRAHHADIGGITPGSMPPDSRTIADEGVLFDGVRVVERGVFREAEVRRLLASGPHPARNPDQNVADLKAQIAANARGVAELDKLVERFGLRGVHSYMEHVQRNAEESVRAAIERLRDGHFAVELDGGERIAVSVAIDRIGRAATIDFAGTSGVSAGNFNAPSAIVRAAVLYVFRTLVRESIPLNAGCLAPLTIRLPEHCLLNPAYPAAVVAGNVETSQCITDALLGALGACAASQGTMNNFTFGNARHQYYETICGGAGAGPSFDGASAVHTHMTNSRLTDPEVLEWRYPVRVLRFEIRAGSGGRGARRGGDGVVREIEFLERMQASILANRRRVAPFGLAGGAPGACGKSYVIRSGGGIEPLAATASVEVQPGDRFVIETPGGGGYGAQVVQD